MHHLLPITFRLGLLAVAGLLLSCDAQVSSPSSPIRLMSASVSVTLPKDIRQGSVVIYDSETVRVMFSADTDASGSVLLAGKGSIMRGQSNKLSIPAFHPEVVANLDKSDVVRFVPDAEPEYYSVSQIGNAEVTVHVMGATEAKAIAIIKSIRAGVREDNPGYYNEPATRQSSD